MKAVVLMLGAVAAGAALAGNVRDFGAVGDGVADDTAAIQRAIDAGGVVSFPKGTYLTGTIYLRSNGGLDIAPDATILATTDRTKYNPPDVCPQNYGAEVKDKPHLIMAIEQTNVVIRGGGTIDGNADRFFGQYRGQYTCTGMGGIRLKRNPDWQVSQMIAFYECEKVRLQDLCLRNSCFWNCHLFGCEQVQVRGLNIKSDPEIAGDDGLDIDCCRHVTVSDCIIDVGDDGITLRANGGKYLRRNRPCEYVAVANCSVRSAYAHAIRVGVGTGVIRHCTFSNLVMENTRCAIHMNPLYGEDGTGVEMDDISFSGVHATAKMFLFLTLDYKWVGKNRFRGTMENIRFTDVGGEAALPVTIRGNGLGVLRNVTWTDSTVRFTDPSALTDADKRFYMFDPEKPLGDKVQIDKAENVIVRNVDIR